MQRLVLALVLLGFSLLPRLAFADGFIIVTESIVRPPPGHPVYAPLEVTEHHVSVVIDGQVATTTVDQEFYNPAPRVVEGTYFFPVPKDAQIEKFQLEIAGKWTDPELLDAAKARAIYEEIVRKAKDPALLEYAGRRLFKARVFPIEANSKKRIRVSYREVLPLDFGALAYRYPLATEKFSAQPLRNLSIKVEVKSEKGFASVYSPSHPASVKTDEGGKRATVDFSAKDSRASTDFELICTSRAAKPDDVPLTLLTYRETGSTAEEDGYFVLFAAPPGDRGKDTKPAPKDVVFVLDTSGSMSGAKIAQARKALAFCVEHLNEGDRFDLIRFSSDNEALFGKLEEATVARRKRADEFIGGLKAMGGTAIHDALKRALEMKPTEGGRPFVVIFLTDGLANIGPSRNEELLAMTRKTIGDAGGVRLFSFGIGNDVNTHLLDQLAEQTRAYSTYVLPEEDVEIKLSNFFAKITEPVLTDLKLELTNADGARVSQLHPNPLPDLFAGDQLVLVGRFRGKGDAELRLLGKRSGREQVFAAKVSLETPAERNSSREFIPRLWATRRVAFLLDEIRLRGENAETREEVVRIARKFGLVTPYTAHLIIEDEARREVPAARRSLGQLDKDAAARGVVAESYSSFKEKQSGAGAVGDARGQNEAKLATRADEANIAQNAEVFRAAKAAPMTAPKAAAVDRIERYTQQNARFVNGRAFYQNGTQWVDSKVQAKGKNASAAQRIEFNSEAYFALLNKHPEAAPWFALGANVLITLGDTDYEIFE